MIQSKQDQVRAMQLRDDDVQKLSKTTLWIN